MLKEGKRDLDICSEFFSRSKFDEGQALKEYRVMHDQVRLMLTMTEVETDLNQLRHANRHLQDSQWTIDELKAKIAPRPNDRPAGSATHTTR